MRIDQWGYPIAGDDHETPEYTPFEIDDDLCRVPSEDGIAAAEDRYYELYQRTPSIVAWWSEADREELVRLETTLAADRRRRARIAARMKKRRAAGGTWATE